MNKPSTRYLDHKARARRERRDAKERKADIAREERLIRVKIASATLGPAIVLTTLFLLDGGFRIAAYIIGGGIIGLVIAAVVFVAMWGGYRGGR